MGTVPPEKDVKASRPEEDNLKSGAKKEHTGLSSADLRDEIGSGFHHIRGAFNRNDQSSTIPLQLAMQDVPSPPAPAAVGASNDVIQANLQKAQDIYKTFPASKLAGYTDGEITNKVNRVFVTSRARDLLHLDVLAKISKNSDLFTPEMDKELKDYLKAGDRKFAINGRMVDPRSLLEKDSTNLSNKQRSQLSDEEKSNLAKAAYGTLASLWNNGFGKQALLGDSYEYFAERYKNAVLLVSPNEVNRVNDSIKNGRQAETGKRAGGGTGPNLSTEPGKTADKTGPDKSEPKEPEPLANPELKKALDRLASKGLKPEANADGHVTYTYKHPKSGAELTIEIEGTVNNPLKVTKYHEKDPYSLDSKKLARKSGIDLDLDMDTGSVRLPDGRKIPMNMFLENMVPVHIENIADNYDNYYSNWMAKNAWTTAGYVGLAVGALGITAGGAWLLGKGIKAIKRGFGELGEATKDEKTKIKEYFLPRLKGPEQEVFKACKEGKTNEAVAKFLDAYAKENKTLVDQASPTPEQAKAARNALAKMIRDYEDKNIFSDKPEVAKVLGALHDQMIDSKGRLPIRPNSTKYETYPSVAELLKEVKDNPNVELVHIAERRQQRQGQREAKAQREQIKEDAKLSPEELYIKVRDEFICKWLQPDSIAKTGSQAWREIDKALASEQLLRNQHRYEAYKILRSAIGDAGKSGKDHFAKVLARMPIEELCERLTNSQFQASRSSSNESDRKTDTTERLEHDVTAVFREKIEFWKKAGGPNDGINVLAACRNIERELKPLGQEIPTAKGQEKLDMQKRYLALATIRDKLIDGVPGARVHEENRDYEPSVLEKVKLVDGWLPGQTPPIISTHEQQQAGEHNRPAQQEPSTAKDQSPPDGNQHPPEGDEPPPPPPAPPEPEAPPRTPGGAPPAAEPERTEQRTQPQQTGEQQRPTTNRNKNDILDASIQISREINDHFKTSPKINNCLKAYDYITREIEKVTQQLAEPDANEIMLKNKRNTLMAIQDNLLGQVGKDGKVGIDKGRPIPNREVLERTSMVKGQVIRAENAGTTAQPNTPTRIGGQPPLGPQPAADENHGNQGQQPPAGDHQAQEQARPEIEKDIANFREDLLDSIAALPEDEKSDFIQHLKTDPKQLTDALTEIRDNGRYSGTFSEVGLVHINELIKQAETNPAKVYASLAAEHTGNTGAGETARREERPLGPEDLTRTTISISDSGIVETERLVAGRRLTADELKDGNTTKALKDKLTERLKELKQNNHKTEAEQKELEYLTQTKPEWAAKNGKARAAFWERVSKGEGLEIKRSPVEGKVGIAIGLGILITFAGDILLPKAHAKEAPTRSTMRPINSPTDK